MVIPKNVPDEDTIWKYDGSGPAPIVANGRFVENTL